MKTTTVSILYIYNYCHLLPFIAIYCHLLPFTAIYRRFSPFAALILPSVDRYRFHRAPNPEVPDKPYRFVALNELCWGVSVNRPLVNIYCAPLSSESTSAR